MTQLLYAIVALSLVLGATTRARADQSGLTLERAVTLASRRSENPRAASERARAAEARVDKARALFLPDVTLKGGYTHRAWERRYLATNGSVVSGGRNALSADAAIEIGLFDARSFPLYSQAKLDRDAADLEALEAVRIVAFDAALAFLAVLGAEQVVAAAERRVDLARVSAAEAAARRASGLAGSNDVTRAELEVATAERELARARGDAVTTRLELSYLVGENVDGPLVVPAALLQAAATPPGAGADAESGVRDRLDVQAAEKAAAALDAASDEPLLGAVPTLSLIGTLQGADEPRFSGHDVDASIGLQLTWILFDGGERYADRDERNALARAGSLDAEAIVRRATFDVRGASSVLRSEQAATVQAEAAVRAAEQNTRETSELYRSGLTSALAVADAVAQLFAAEVDLVRARYGVAQALLEVRRAAGFDPLGKAVR